MSNQILSATPMLQVYIFSSLLLTWMSCGYLTLNCPLSWLSVLLVFWSVFDETGVHPPSLKLCAIIPDFVSNQLQKSCLPSSHTSTWLLILVFNLAHQTWAPLVALSLQSFFIPIHRDFSGESKLATWLSCF